LLEFEDQLDTPGFHRCPPAYPQCSQQRKADQREKIALALATTFFTGLQWRRAIQHFFLSPLPNGSADCQIRGVRNDRALFAVRIYLSIAALCCDVDRSCCGIGHGSLDGARDLGRLAIEPNNSASAADRPARETAAPALPGEAKPRDFSLDHLNCRFNRRPGLHRFIHRFGRRPLAVVD
jgi:hypothetical protein